jgi:ribosome-associated protein
MAGKKKDQTEQLLHSIVNGMLERKAHDVVVLDLRGLNSSVTDYFVICHGSSSTQVQGIARSVEEMTEKELRESPSHTEGVANAQWILMDYFNVVVHIFEEGARKYYSIEELWADAEQVEIEVRA